MAEKQGTKLCKYCKTEIPAGAKVCPNCRKKQGGVLKWAVIAVVVLVIIGAAAGGGDDDSKSKQASNSSNANSNSETFQKETQDMEKENTPDEDAKEEVKDKYHVGDTWENKNIKVIYKDCYEFTDYNQYNAPADGNKIICAEFEFENIGKSDTSVMYTDFHGYADGYEVNQSYAPDGTGLDFSVKMSAGRKGTGKIAFEIPEDAQEIEIEFSPNMFSSDKVIFAYE